MTSFIKRLYTESFSEHKEKKELRVFTRLGVMKVPNNLESPLILIATGIGILRFKGLIEEISESTIYVYYGCKDKNSILVHELNELVKKKMIDTLELAISQNVEYKKHVQDIIREHKEELYYIIKKKKGIVMVCTNFAAEKNIKEAFIDSFNGKESDPYKFFDEMKANKQYIKELWNIS